MARMFSVTCPEEQYLFIQEKEISPSSIFQTAIQQIMDASKISEEFVKELQDKITRMMATIDQQRNFIEEKELMDEFLGLKDGI